MFELGFKKLHNKKRQQPPYSSPSQTPPPTNFNKYKGKEGGIKAFLKHTSSMKSWKTFIMSILSTFQQDWKKPIVKPSS
jgi:hypothetical protein